MKTCHSCGAADLPNPAKVCGYCGTPLKVDAPDTATSPDPSDGRTSAVADLSDRPERLLDEISEAQAPPEKPNAPNPAGAPTGGQTGYTSRAAALIAAAVLIWAGLSLEWASVSWTEDGSGGEWAVDGVDIGVSVVAGGAIGPDVSDIPLATALLLAGVISMGLGLGRSTRIGRISKWIGFGVMAALLVVGARLVYGVDYRWEAVVIAGRTFSRATLGSKPGLWVALAAAAVLAFRDWQPR